MAHLLPILEGEGTKAFAPPPDEYAASITSGIALSRRKGRSGRGPHFQLNISLETILGAFAASGPVRFSVADAPGYVQMRHSYAAADMGPGSVAIRSLSGSIEVTFDAINLELHLVLGQHEPLDYERRLDTSDAGTKSGQAELTLRVMLPCHGFTEMCAGDRTGGNLAALDAAYGQRFGRGLPAGPSHALEALWAEKTAARDAVREQERQVREAFEASQQAVRDAAQAVRRKVNPFLAFYDWVRRA